MKITIKGSIERHGTEEIEVTETFEDYGVVLSSAEQAIEELAAKVARKLIAAAVA